jgi:hypothetical protein
MSLSDSQEEWIDLDINHEIIEPLAHFSISEEESCTTMVAAIVSTPGVSTLDHISTKREDKRSSTKREDKKSSTLDSSISKVNPPHLLVTEEHILWNDSDSEPCNPFDIGQSQQNKIIIPIDDDATVTTPSRYDSDECLTSGVRHKKQSIDSWRRLVHQSLSVYQLLGKSGGSEKKKEQLVDSVMHTIQEDQQFDRVGRFHLVHHLMLELKDTILDENQKKNIVIQLLDIMIDAIVEDVTWYNDCRNWLQNEALSLMDFLYQVQPEKYQPSPFWKFINK